MTTRIIPSFSFPPQNKVYNRYRSRSKSSNKRSRSKSSRKKSRSPIRRSISKSSRKKSRSKSPKRYLNRIIPSFSFPPENKRRSPKRKSRSKSPNRKSRSRKSRSKSPNRKSRSRKSSRSSRSKSSRSKSSRSKSSRSKSSRSRKSRSRTRKGNTSEISSKPFKNTNEISSELFKKSNSEKIEKYTMWFDNKNPPPKHINKLILEFKYKGCTSPFLVPIKENFMTLRSKKQYKTGLYNYPDNSIFIALIEKVGKKERVVGFAVLIVYDSEIYVGDLCTWIDTKGNGKIMINIIKEWARGIKEKNVRSINGYKRPILRINMSEKRNGVNITLYSLQEAIGFYRRMGFVSLQEGKTPCNQSITLIKSDGDGDLIGRNMGICV